jgi:starch phosphorylase
MIENFPSPNLPKRISGLNELAYNLWWSWHIEAREVFNILDRPLWKATGHNPVKLLQRIPPYRLVAAAENPDFLKKYDFVMNEFHTNISTSNTWLTAHHPSLLNHTIAYFSLEFAIHNSLPLYAGGLGILAGDYCKEASDLGLPMIGIGFMYPQGYFRQRISADGWQEEIYDQLNFEEAPIIPILDANGDTMKVDVPMDDRIVKVALFQVNVGRVKLYLLDTNIEENPPADRHLSDRLYVGEREMRLAQEIIVGIGGVRVLRALAIEPKIWHANEGHSAFMMVERIRELIESGVSFKEALEQVKATTIFTTHTPVPAGNEVFSVDLIDKYFHKYWTALGLDRNAFLSLASQDSDKSGFNMTILALRLSNQRNGVSQLHGKVCRKMWHSLWPDVEENDVPISSITNGVHVPTWIAPQMARLYEKYVAPDWLKRHDEPAIWEHVLDMPDEEVWAARRWLKSKLISAVDDWVRKRWSEDAIQAVQAIAMGVFLNTEALTIGFSRRFTDYKRNTLILHDSNRLKRILKNQLQPVQIVFAGKAHPYDISGKYLIQEIYRVAKDPEIGGRIAFVENYDMHMARYLIHGVDIWLNTPQPIKEASGTSGMKAALNGVPHLSILDGWWHEGYNGANGWAINPIHHDGDELDSPEQNKENAEELYSLLEEKIIPLYYERDIYGIPHGWIKLIKETIRSNIALFSACRMVKEYTKQLYVKASKTTDATPPEPPSSYSI